MASILPDDSHDGDDIDVLRQLIEGIEQARRAEFLSRAVADDRVRRQLAEEFTIDLDGHGDPGGPDGPLFEGPLFDGPLFNEPVETPVTTPSATAATSGSSPEVDAVLKRGTIGPYKLLAHIGSGGMGSVYLAAQRRGVRRKVAIKVVRTGLMSEHVLRRFEVERQALSVMSHPNIASVFDVGETADGMPYFVMEYVEGVSLSEYCGKHRLDLRDRIRLLQQVCVGIQHAHQRGIIHRDLKPGNILVAQDGDRPIAKIIDFGLARALDPMMVEHSVFTEVGQILGTLEYMSPEQVEIGGEGLDTRTDIYALGAMLYQLLSGDLPFPSKLLRRRTLGEIQRTIREVEPAKPSERVLGRDSMATASDPATHASSMLTTQSRLARALRGELDWITMKALAKEPSRRYQSALEFSDDLERYLREEAVSAGPPSNWYRLTKYLAKRRVAVATLAAIVLTTVSVFAVSYRQQAYAAKTRRNLERLATVSEADALLEQFDEVLHDPQASRDDSWLQRTVRVLADRESILGIDDEEMDLPVLQAALEDGRKTLDTLSARYDDLRVRRAHRDRALAASHHPRCNELWADILARIEARLGWRLERIPGVAPLGRSPNGSYEFLHLESCDPAWLEDPTRWTSTGTDHECGLVFTLVLPPGGGTVEVGGEIDRRALPPGMAIPESGPFHDRWRQPATARISTPLLVSKYEITQAQWMRLAGSNPSQYTQIGYLWLEDTRTHPVERIAPSRAIHVLAGFGMRIPTEDEWEYAARGGHTGAWDTTPAGNMLDLSLHRVFPDADFAMESHDDRSAAHGPVGRYEPNGFGLYDVWGNVAELCTATDSDGVWARGWSFKTPSRLCHIPKRAYARATGSSSIGVRPILEWSAPPREAR